MLSALLRCGYNVLIPFGPARYDLVREKDVRFERIQCKTAVLTKTGALRFAVTNTPPSMTHKTYVGEVDFFGVYSPDLERVTLCPLRRLPAISERCGSGWKLPATAKLTGRTWPPSFFLSLARRRSSDGKSNGLMIRGPVVRIHPSLP